MRYLYLHRWRRLAAVDLAIVLALAFSLPAPALAQSDNLLNQARTAARSDRNAESARLFARFLTQHPDQRRQLLREYADQLLYSNRPDQAAVLLREVLGWDLSADERRSARKSYALALLWSDRHREALAAYGAILATDPGDEDSTFNRLRAAQWMGRPDTAARMLAGLAPGLRQSPTGTDLLKDIDRSARPQTEAKVSGFDQADGLRLERWRVDQRLFALSGAAMVQATFERSRFDDRDSAPLVIDAPELQASWRASDWLQLGALAALERQRGPAIDRTLLAYEASAAFLPADNLRLDLVTSRRSLDNLESLRLGITTRNHFASLDYWPDSLLKLTARGELTRFSDGNQRRWLQLEAERRISRSPNLFLGARATALGFDEQLDHGYFNPKSLRSIQATARGWSKIGARSWLDVSAAAGPEHGTPGGSKLTYWARAKLTHGLADRLEASLTAERISAGQTATGFSRNSLSGAIRFRW